jgi:hypothetical protein
MPATSLSAREQEWLAKRKTLKVVTLLCGPLAGFPVAFVVGVVSHSEVAVFSIAAVSVLLGVVFGLRYQFARCPQCSRLFWEIPGKWHFLWHTDHCRNCGFPGVDARQEPIQPPQTTTGSSAPDRV